MRCQEFRSGRAFYADKQKASVKAMIEESGSILKRIPYKVEGVDMLEYLKGEADDLLSVIACGIEDCILPSFEYRKSVEGEIYRVLEKDAFFLSSHSDLKPQGLRMLELCFQRPANPKVEDRLRLYGSDEAFEKYGEYLDGGMLAFGKNKTLRIIPNPLSRSCKMTCPAVYRATSTTSLPIDWRRKREILLWSSISISFPPTIPKDFPD